MGDNVSLIDGHIDEIDSCKLCGAQLVAGELKLCKACENKTEAFINSIEMALDYNMPVTDKELAHYRKLLNIIYKS